MSAENNQSNKVVEDKSTYKLKGEINFKKELEVNKIFADPNLIAQHRDRLSKGIKNITPQILDFEIVQVVIKDNLFSTAMNEIVQYFDFSIDNDYLNFIKDNLKKSLGGQNVPEDTLNMIADKIVKKGIVFKHLTKHWNVEVTDDEVKGMLDVYYQRTNESIRDVLQDKEKFESIRQAILEEKLILKTISAFPIRFNLINPTFESSQPIDGNKKN